MRVIKTAEDLNEIPWRHLTRKEWLECSSKGVSGIWIVTDRDIEVFIDYQMRKVAIELKLPLEEVKNIFVEKNLTFYALKNNLFNVNTGYCQCLNSLPMDVIRELFHVPCLSECCKNNVDLLFQQKMEYLRNLSKLSKAERRRLRKKLKIRKLKF